MSKLAVLSPVSNGAKQTVEIEQPFTVEFELEGTSPMLFHKWDNEAVKEKSEAKKNSKAKKEDNLESYVYRNDKGELCIPGEYVRQGIIHAAKYKQDPRSPRKSAMDIVKAGVISFTELASLGTKEWDYLDKRRVVIQRNAITRCRPAFDKGWRAEFQFQVILPEYIEPQFFHELLIGAGRYVGIADFRPTYGRFQVVQFKILK